MADEFDLDTKIENIAHDIGNAVSYVEWQTWGAAALYVLVGFLAAGFASNFIGRVLEKHTTPHYTLIFKRVFYYGIITVSVLLALATLHLDMKVLGIATIVTLGIGFASQTAVSNVISGLFLVFEQPFVVGDQIEYKGIVGELLSIDLLSIKIRTSNNSQVRIPNEELLKNQFINLTHFPKRRLDIRLRVSMSQDMDKVREVLFDLARKNMLVLDNPAPQLLFTEFNEAAIVFDFAVWVEKEFFDKLKHSLTYDIQKAFSQHGFKLPITHYLQVEKSGYE
jgi:small-conductance mechanosensitive channel